MTLLQAITRVGIGKNLLLCSVVGSNIQVAVGGIYRELVPEALDTVVLHLRIVEVRMRQIETDILHTHDYTFTCIGLRKVRSLIQGINSLDNVRGVHQGRSALTGLNTSHMLVHRQTGQATQRNTGNIDVAELCQLQTMILLQHLIGILIDSHKGTNG